jgi:hypothetical protein
LCHLCSECSNVKKSTHKPKKIFNDESNAIDFNNLSQKIDESQLIDFKSRKNSHLDKILSKSNLLKECMIEPKKIKVSFPIAPSKIKSTEEEIKLSNLA